MRSAIQKYYQFKQCRRLFTFKFTQIIRIYIRSFGDDTNFEGTHFRKKRHTKTTVVIFFFFCSQYLIDVDSIRQFHYSTLSSNRSNVLKNFVSLLIESGISLEMFVWIGTH